MIELAAWLVVLVVGLPIACGLAYVLFIAVLAPFAIILDRLGVR